MTDDSKKKAETQSQEKKANANQQKVEKSSQEKRDKHGGDIPMLKFGAASNNFLKFMKHSLLLL
jgi:hypothetical protein